MIGKVTSGSKPSGILYYCYYEKETFSEAMKQKLRPEDVRGEIVYIQNLSLNTFSDGRFDMDYLANQFSACASQNKGLKKFVWHQSFSFPHGETPTVEQIQEIAVAFAKDFGFENNQLIAFQHRDTAHDHFHIVANRINHEGKTTANDGYSYLKTGSFCRKIELQMGLQITPTMKALDKEQGKTPEKIIQQQENEVRVTDRLRDSLDRHLPKSQTMKDLKALLAKEGIQLYQKRGVSFVDKKTGAQIKGSDLGRAYSLANLEKRLGVVPQEPPKELSLLIREQHLHEDMPKKQFSDLLVEIPKEQLLQQDKLKGIKMRR